MAPNRGSSSKGSAGKSSGGSKGKSSTLSSASRVSKSSAKVKRPPPKEMKSKARTAPENLKKKKKRVYTEKELDLPALNMITPVGVVKPKGKKKGKTFVDDQVGTIDLHCGKWYGYMGLISFILHYIGEHDDNSRYGQCRKRGPD
jgi:60S ribosomal subunit assembly/export protein LOC1